MPVLAATSHQDARMVADEPGVLSSFLAPYRFTLYYWCNKLLLPLGSFVLFIYFCFYFPYRYPLSSLTLGGPALCLNFGPSSDLGVNEGWVPCMLPFGFSLGFPFVHL